MEYEVTATYLADEEVYKVDVVFLDADGNDVWPDCSINVAAATEAEAKEYAERVFIPDLRRNRPKKLDGLVLKWEEELVAEPVVEFAPEVPNEVTEEPPVEEPPVEEPPTEEPPIVEPEP